MLKSWPLILPGVAGLGLHSLVAVEPRYVAAFGGADTDSSIFRNSFEKNQSGYQARSHHSVDLRGLADGDHRIRGLSPCAAASNSSRSGGNVLSSGGSSKCRRAGSLGRPLASLALGGMGMMWARAARLRIVAQIIPENADDFWQMPNPQKEAEVYEAFAKTGAKAVVTEDTPPPGDLASWQGVGAPVLCGFSGRADWKIDSRARFILSATNLTDALFGASLLFYGWCSLGDSIRTLCVRR